MNYDIFDTQIQPRGRQIQGKSLPWMAVTPGFLSLIQGIQGIQGIFIFYREKIIEMRSPQQPPSAQNKFLSIGVGKKGGYPGYLGSAQRFCGFQKSLPWIYPGLKSPYPGFKRQNEGNNCYAR